MYHQKYCQLQEALHLVYGYLFFANFSKIKNVFWKDVFKAWQSYKTSFEKEINIRTYPLWDTYFLTNTNIINRKFQSKGINIINDLLHVSGGLMGLMTLTQLMT